MKATKIRTRPKPKAKLVKLIVERQISGGRYEYQEIHIPESLANKLYDEGTIWWDITNEMFGCDQKNYSPSWTEPSAEEPEL